MKKVMIGVGLGLATASASQAHAWTGDIEDMRTMQANKSGSVVRVKSSRVECCRLRPVRAHGHAHQTKRIYNGRTYYCSDATAQHRSKHGTHHAVQRQHVAPHKVYQRNHQQALQAQRAKRQAMYAAQAKRKAQLLAQQRKRAAMLEQQKRRKIQLAQQQQRAAHQAAMLAAKKRRAAQLIQQKRRAAQLAQQRQQQAQKRQLLLAQQKRRAAQQRVVQQQPCNCAKTRKPVRVVKPVVHHRQQVIARQNVVQQFVPREEVISRRVITTHVQPSQVPARTIVRPRISPSQNLAQQSVAHHDRQHSRSGWQQTVRAANVSQHVQYTQPHVQAHQVTVTAPAVNHEARLRRQRVKQIRAAQIAAQRQRQKQAMHQHHHTATVSSIKMAPVASYVAPAYVVERPSYSGSSSYTASSGHNGGWQRGASVNPHRVGTGYEMYKG